MVIKHNSSKFKNINSNSDKSGMILDIRTLDILVKYVLSTSSYLRMNHLSNLKRLMSYQNLDNYSNDIDKTHKIIFINKALEARIVYNLKDINMILSHINSEINFDINFIDMDNIALDANEVLWCHNMVSSSLQYYFVYDAADSLIDICTDIKTTDYSHRGDVIKRLESTVDDLKNKFRQSKSADNLTDITFSLKDGVFEDAVKETYNEVTSPSRKLRSGMQGLNEMVGGGFESGRIYMILGLAGMGKSVTLLNLAYQLKRYNKYFKPKDPTKTPCIVLLTMENGVVETITRLFDMVIAQGQTPGMENYDVDEVIRKFRQEGELVLNDDSPIDIVIKYKANRSVDTSYLYELTDDLEDEGYEVICLLQDHIKRIRSVEGQQDLRLELGDVVNEFKTFALDKDIPVISAGHLNRDAAKIVEDSSTRSPSDVTMKLGKSNTGESFLMIDNSDCAMIVNPDYDDTGNKYMAINLIKMRDKTNRTYIVQPFLYGSGIRLAEDVGSAPVFKEYLHLNKDISRNPSIRTSSSNVMSSINNASTNSTYSNDGLYSFSPDPDNSDIEAAKEESVSETKNQESALKTTVHIRPVRFESDIHDPIDDIIKLKNIQEKMELAKKSLDDIAV